MDDLVEKTKRTAALYFEGIEEEKPYALWKAFDPELARDLSLFITGKMYAREKLPHPTRQLVTVAALTVLGRGFDSQCVAPTVQEYFNASRSPSCTPATTSPSPAMSTITAPPSATIPGMRSSSSKRCWENLS